VDLMVFLTEAGEYRDCFTLQYVAGHGNIKDHDAPRTPREAAVHNLFARLGRLAAAGGAHRVQEVGAKSGAVGNALTGRIC
jgi:hypothetical protein